MTVRTQDDQGREVLKLKASEVFHFYVLLFNIWLSFFEPVASRCIRFKIWLVRMNRKETVHEFISIRRCHFQFWLMGRILKLKNFQNWKQFPQSKSSRKRTLILQETLLCIIITNKRIHPTKTRKIVDVKAGNISLFYCHTHCGNVLSHCPCVRLCINDLKVQI